MEKMIIEKKKLNDENFEKKTKEFTEKINDKKRDKRKGPKLTDEFRRILKSPKNVICFEIINHDINVHYIDKKAKKSRACMYQVKRIVNRRLFVDVHPSYFFSIKYVKSFSDHASGFIVRFYFIKKVAYVTEINKVKFELLMWKKRKMKKI